MIKPFILKDRVILLHNKPFFTLFGGFDALTDKTFLACLNNAYRLGRLDAIKEMNVKADKILERFGI